MEEAVARMNNLETKINREETLRNDELLPLHEDSIFHVNSNDFR